MFCGDDGRMLGKNEVKHPLWRACRKAGLRQIGWHVLRHTYASHLAMRGAPLKAIQELLGHATIEMTMRYAHLSPGARRDSARLWRRRESNPCEGSEQKRGATRTCPPTQQNRLDRSLPFAPAPYHMVPPFGAESGHQEGTKVGEALDGIVRAVPETVDAVNSGPSRVRDASIDALVARAEALHLQDRYGEARASLDEALRLLTVCRAEDLSTGMMEPSTTRRGTVSSVGLVLLAMLACGGEPRHPPGPQIHDKPGDAATADLRLPARPPAIDAGAPPSGHPPLQERPPSAGCVVHAGDIRQSTTRSKPPGGALEAAKSSSACSMDAECVQRQGTATPGDRNVAIDCKGRMCTCTQEQLVPRIPRRKFRFAVDAPCATMERVQSLLLDRCAQGTNIAPQPKKAGPHPR